RNSSDEVSPEVPASADTEAMAAGCGRRDALSMRGSPRSRFPSKQSGRHGCGSFFSRNRGWPHVQIRPARTIWRPQYIVSAPVFSRIRRSGTRLMLGALVSSAERGVEMWLALAAICLLRRKDLVRVGSGTLENKPAVRSPQLTGEANGCYYTKC